MIKTRVTSLPSPTLLRLKRRMILPRRPFGLRTIAARAARVVVGGNCDRTLQSLLDQAPHFAWIHWITVNFNLAGGVRTIHRQTDCGVAW